MQPLLADIFAELKNTKSKKQKIQILRRHDNDEQFKELCAYAVNPHLKWMIPEGAPPYKKGEPIDAEGVFWTEIRRLYIFIDCPQAGNLNTIKVQGLFIDMLENLHPDDAELLIAIKDRKRIGITEKLIKETWPGLLSYA